MSVFLNNLTERYTKRANPDVATTVSQSLIQLSSGIYTEEERFVFELLQNAVDAFDDITGAFVRKIEKILIFTEFSESNWKEINVNRKYEQNC